MVLGWTLFRLLVIGRHLVRQQAETNYHLKRISESLEASVALKQAELGMSEAQPVANQPQQVDAEVGGVAYRDNRLLSQAAAVEQELTRVLGRSPDDEEVWAQLEHRL